MVSLRDVAHHAGVSMMTVSNVVNGRPGVSVATRAVVERSINDLGYRPNLSARHLAQGRTGMLTLAIPEVEIPYFAELSSAMMREAARHSMGILIDQTGWDRRRELDLLSGSLSHLTDAVLLFPATLDQGDLVDASPGVPLVLFGGSQVFDGVDHVVIDNEVAGELATGHLLGLGHLRIGLIGPSLEPSSPKPNSRLAGHRRALRAAGVAPDPELVVSVSSYHRQDGFDAMMQLLSLSRPPTAVFCMSDLLAVGALHAAHRRGVAVPGDLSVVGFDDVEEGRFANPALTSVRPDKSAIAARAIELALEQIRGDGGERSPRSVIVGHDLIVRDSTSALPLV